MHPRSLVAALLVFLSMLLAVPQSLAQGKRGSFSGAAAPFEDEPIVSLRAFADRSSLAPGDTAVVAVLMQMKEGWKLHTNTPQIPASWGDFVAIPTVIAPTPAGGLRTGTIQWPQASTVQIDLAGTGTPDDYLVYKGNAVAFVPVLLPADSPAIEDVLTLSLAVTYQACDDTTCARPETETLTISFVRAQAGEVGAKAALSPGDQAMLAAFDVSSLARLAAGEIEVVKQAASPRSSGSVLVINDFGLNWRIDTAGLGIVVVLVIAALGGLLLNLMPCVLPVIPIKIMGLQKSAGTAKRRIMLGLIMSAGVIAFWIVIGLILGLSSSLVAGSQLFAIWWFALGIGAFILLMGLGMLGIFDVGLPQWVYTLNPKHDSAVGSFGFGVLTAILALPCVAPFMGTAMSWALGRPLGVALATFAAIGVGMAVPYAVLAINPKLVSWLPKTGPASALLKQVMGMLMIAVALFFFATGFQSLVKSSPHLAGVLHWWIILAVVLATAVWLVVQTFRITKSPARRAAFTLVALFLAGSTFIWAKAQTTAAYRSQIWKHYDSALVEKARRDGKVLVIDFTADWCLNCKTLKATVLTTDAVIAAISDPNVVPVEVDLTATDAPGWDLLRTYGESGIPLLVIEGPGLREPWKGNAYTTQNVIDAINAARATRQAEASTRPPATTAAISGSPTK